MKNKSGLYDEDVEISRAISEEMIYHSHPVRELMPTDKIISLLAGLGCEDVCYFESRPNMELLNLAKKKKIILERSPLEMYILVVRKDKN